jgi:xanthine dehydrogenase accessory factor
LPVACRHSSIAVHRHSPRHPLLAQLASFRTERRAVLATLVAVSGRAPTRVGATMWVGAGGRILGSVTIGGCVDARVVGAAERVLESGIAERLEVPLDDDEAFAIGLTCSGAVELFVEPVALDDDRDPLVAALRAASATLEHDCTAVIVERMDGTRARLVCADGLAPAGTLGDATLDAVAREHAMPVLGGAASGALTTRDASGIEARLFARRLEPSPTILVVGAGEIAMALVALARPLGMRTIVVDGRARFATRERFPTAGELHVGMPSALVEGAALGRSTAVVLVAHDYRYEPPVLRHVLRSDAGYVGMLGSRRRGAAVRAALAEEGMDEASLARLRTPVGLDIGARDAAEIALSILAELVAVRSGSRRHATGGPEEAGQAWQARACARAARPRSTARAAGRVSTWARRRPPISQPSTRRREPSRHRRRRARAGLRGPPPMRM